VAEHVRVTSVARVDVTAIDRNYDYITELSFLPNNMIKASLDKFCHRVE